MQVPIAVRPDRAHFASLLAGVALLLSFGCTSANSNRTGRADRATFALAQAECNQSDSTISCCLKKHPYSPESCGVEAPARFPRPPILLPPPGATDPAGAEELPTPAERERWRSEICEPHYDKCVDKGGGTKPGRVHNETQCKACYEYCTRRGFWPSSANGKRCPGG